MKYMLAFLMALAPFFIQAQEERKFDDEFGVHLTYNGNDGAGVSLRYRKGLKNAGMLKFEVNSNLKDAWIGRLGYELIRADWGNVELSLGLDLKYKYLNYSKYNLDSNHEVAFEFPIDFRWKLSEEFSLQVGTSLSQRLWRKNNLPESNHRASEIRVGFGYKF